MFEKITLTTDLVSGSRLKRTYSDGRVEYYTVDKYISFVKGYELKYDGINTGEDEGLILYATKLNMMMQGWEVEV